MVDQKNEAMKFTSSGKITNTVDAKGSIVSDHHCKNNRTFGEELYRIENNWTKKSGKGLKFQ